MGTKKNIKSIIGAAITATALVSGSASAEMVTGTIFWTATSSNGYTYVNILQASGSPKFGYYTGTNSAIATILDNAKRFKQKVTVTIDDNTNKILVVR